MDPGTCFRCLHLTAAGACFCSSFRRKPESILPLTLPGNIDNEEAKWIPACAGMMVLRL